MDTYDVEAEGEDRSEWAPHAKPTMVLFDEDPDPEETECEAAGEGGTNVCDVG